MISLRMFIEGLPEEEQNEIQLKTLLLVREELTNTIYDVRETLASLLEKRKVESIDKWREIYAPSISFYTSADGELIESEVKRLQEATKSLYQVDMELRKYWKGEVRE